MPESKVVVKTGPRSSNLHITHSFTEKEKHDFIEGAFDYISKFFEASAKELEVRNIEIESSFKRVDSNRFETKIYRKGELKSQCSIFLSDSGQQIKYSGELGATNSWNEDMSVSDDGTVLLLRPSFMQFHTESDNDSERLSQQGGAEYLWGIVIEPLQR